MIVEGKQNGAKQKEQEDERNFTKNQSSKQTKQEQKWNRIFENVRNKVLTNEKHEAKQTYCFLVLCFFFVFFFFSIICVFL
jgi:hypothetical protein